MAMIATDTRTLTHEAWLEARRKGIGGSDAAACAGLNPWKSPLALYMEKRGEVSDTAENESMEWGNRLEPLVADKFAEVTGLKLRRRNAIFRHPDHPWMLANVDRLIVGVDEGLEVKTTSEYARDQWDGDDVPAQYLLQCQHYMAVTGYSAWWIAVLIGGNKFRYKRIERDEVLIADLIEIEREFWRRVEEGDPPFADGSEPTTELIKSMFPVSQPGVEVELEPEAKDWIAQYKFNAQAEKEAAERKEEAANRIKLLMGDAESAVSGEHRVTWKSVPSERIDTKSLKQAHPAIAAQFVKVSPSRRFSIK